MMRWLVMVTAAGLALQSRGDGGIRLPDQPEIPDIGSGNPEGRSLDGRGFLDWVGLGEDQDPYILKSTKACISGDLADCFKAQALRSFDDFFDQQTYDLSANAKVIKMESQARALSREPAELGSTPRSDDTEWDALVKYGLRKIERFLRSTALEMELDDEVTAGGVIAPRFLDEINDEVDILEDKRAPLFKRNKLKKLIVPMLLILKLFKLKLLLFLPLVLGLASFKKFLGFMALIVPGVIGYFKFCKPNLQSPFTAGHYAPQYTPAGIGLQHFNQPSYQYGHHDGYSHGNRYSSNGVAFREDAPQDLAYQGWGEYRGSKTEVKAET